jgi:hypothetical protein
VSPLTEYRPHARLLAAAAVVSATLCALGASSAAATPAASTPSTSTTVLPLFGVPLTLEVTLATDGALASVAINSADPDGWVAQTRPGSVVFTKSGPKQATVVVRAHEGKQRSAVHAPMLADVSGSVPRPTR